MRCSRPALLPVLLLLEFFSPLAAARQPARARHAKVSAEEPLAVDAGVAVLKAGGNAVDAAVAMGFALAATLPRAGNLGGGGFALVRMAGGAADFVDFRERAPEKATRTMYLGPDGSATRDSIEGWRAVGVPGTVRGLEFLHRKWGTKPWKDLVAPSVALARDGFVVSWGLEGEIRSKRDLLNRFPESKRIYAGLQAGDKFVQPELAATLERIRSHGAAGFYEGETARRLSKEMREHGGLITESDLKKYRVAVRKPLLGRYKDLDIITSPPPSSGGIGLLQMLGMLEGTQYAASGAGAADTIHYVAEAMRRFYADRSEFIADPDFVRIPVRSLLEPAYISRLRASIDPARATPSGRVRPGAGATFGESSETTQISIVDAQGNCVSLTYTLNASFGSGVTAPGLGFLLNNEMDDFTAKPGTPNYFGLVQGERNAIQPGKRPLSSMVPSIVLRGGKPYIVIGGPGGARIPSSVLQVLLNIVDHKLNVQDAVDRPRFHHQWQPDELSMEPGFSPDTIRLLEAKGHKVAITNSVARIEAIVVTPAGVLEGAADGRTYGKAEGY